MNDTKDLRSPLARARDEWLESEGGRAAADVTTLRTVPADSPYLQNRLESAFLAGARWGQANVDPTAPLMVLLHHLLEGWVRPIAEGGGCIESVAYLCCNGGPQTPPMACPCRGETWQDHARGILADLPDEAGDIACTGAGARWCPACGSCTCEYDDAGRIGQEDSRCPLHGLTSNHAAALERDFPDLFPEPQGAGHG